MQGLLCIMKNQHLAMLARDSPTCNAMHGYCTPEVLGLPALKLIRGMAASSRPYRQG